MTHQDYIILLCYAWILGVIVGRLSVKIGKGNEELYFPFTIVSIVISWILILLFSLILIN